MASGSASSLSLGWEAMPPLILISISPERKSWWATTSEVAKEARNVFPDDVADVVAVGVVDILEVVDVKHHAGDGDAVTLGLGQPRL